MSNASEAAGALRATLEATPTGLRRDVLVAEIRALVAALSERSIDEIPADRGFRELGVKSKDVLALKDRLEEILDESVPATAVMDYPTIDAVAAFLLEKMFGGAPAAAAPPAEVKPAPEPAAAAAADADLSMDDLAALLEAELDATKRK